ncbi:alpha/beta fold hydrolase [Agrococcus baldri]|uniref:Peroxidase n=1 Tax=Agrococcus baldri TaxID=153730 RepID=A0AA87RA63_9MICO|nr:alpha/beta hydrolase [Agrococcus baldri]GEK79116.1 peroxidase [Agrococcus baldri]
MIAPEEAVRVATGDVQLVGDVWPASAEPRGSVVLLHGGGQRRHSWRRTGERLAQQGWTAFAFDARGHGESGWSPDGDYSMNALVRDLQAIIGSLDEAPVLVGASMGGMTALMGEAEQKGLSRGLVLVDVVARLEPDGVERIRAFMEGVPEGFATLEDASDAIAAYNPHRPRPKSVEGLRKNLRRADDGRWHWHWDPAFLRIDNEPARESRHERARIAASRIRVPTLLVRGAESDIVSRAGIEEMLMLIPESRAVEVPATGHMVAGDDNDVFTGELERFLAAL